MLPSLESLQMKSCNTSLSTVGNSEQDSNELKIRSSYEGFITTVIILTVVCVCVCVWVVNNVCVFFHIYIKPISVCTWMCVTVCIMGGGWMERDNICYTWSCTKVKWVKIWLSSSQDNTHILKWSGKNCMISPQLSRKPSMKVLWSACICTPGVDQLV